MLLGSACGKPAKTADEYLEIAQEQLQRSKQFDVSIDLSGTIKTTYAIKTEGEQVVNSPIAITGHLKKTENNKRAYAQGYVSVQVSGKKPTVNVVQKYADIGREKVYARQSKTQTWYIFDQPYDSCELEGTGIDLKDVLEDMKGSVSMEKADDRILLTGKENGTGVITQVLMKESTGELRKIHCKVDIPTEIFSGITYQKGEILVEFAEEKGDRVVIPQEALEGKYVSNHSEKGGNGSDH